MSQIARSNHSFSDNQKLSDSLVAKRGVLILDKDHQDLRKAIEAIMPVEWSVSVHTKLDDLLAAGLPSFPSCLLLGDSLHDGVGGLGLYGELLRRNWNLPTVFVSMEWNLRAVVTAMRAGADGFLAKPIDPAELHEAVHHALDRALGEHFLDLSVSDARKRVASLNSRELEVVRLVISGLLNKEIADQLDLALVTVKLYRSRAMKKLGAGNPAEMVKIATAGGLDLGARQSTRFGS